MNTSGGRIIRLATGQAPMVAMGVVVCFALALMGVLKFGLPIWALIIPAAIAVYALAVVQNPVIGLLVVICTLYVPIQLGTVSFLQLVGVGTSGLIVLWALFQRSGIRMEPFLIPLLIFGVLICSSFMYARDIGRVAIFLRIWACILMLVLLMTNLITRHDIFKKVIWTMIAMASINVVVGWFQYVSATEANVRVAGLLEHTNELGFISVTSFPLAFYQFLYRSDRLKWLALGLSVLLAGGVVMSAGRSASFAILIVLLATMITERRRFITIILVLALAICTLPFLPDYYLSRVSGLLEDAKNTVLLSHSEQLTPRGMLNKAAINIWLTSPVWGVGIGNFGHYFVEKEFNPGFRRSSKVPPHNTYMQALAEMGVLGLANFLGLLGLVVWHIFQARRFAFGDVDIWQYHGGVQMVILVILVTSATGTNIMQNSLWMLLCLAPISHRLAASNRAETRSPRAAA